MTVLERGQQYKRLKALYEAEYPETKQYVAGVNGSNKVQGNDDATADSAVASSFVADTAAKTNHSERVIREEVQVATNIPARVQTAIKDLPVADNKSDLLKLSRLNRMDL